nr:unnamed protein product [Digitaria exilis]
MVALAAGGPPRQSINQSGMALECGDAGTAWLDVVAVVALVAAPTAAGHWRHRRVCTSEPPIHLATKG